MGAEEIVPEKPVKEQIRDQKRAVDRSKRNLIREQKKLEREKKKMLQEIKKMALKGQTTGAKMLAKDIVRSTNQIKKLDQFVGQLTAVSMRISSCSTLNELGDAMTNAANAMTLVSNKLDPKKMQQMAKVMAKEDFKLEMISDMMGEAMDSIGESMGNEEEEEELYNQVLAEAGVKLEGELTGAQKDTLQSQVSEKKQLAEVGPEGAGGSGGSGPAPADGGDDDLDAMLRSLNQK
jgi:charged multivesicular body protein 2A